MDFKKILNSIKDFVLWLVLTKHCRYCNKLVTKNEDLCADCRENLPRIDGEKCGFCGTGKERCSCKKRRMKYDSITAPFYYEGSIQESLKLLKFNNKSFIADVLAEDMAKSVQKDFNGIDFDFVCFVPFSNMQKTDRNYNQSELLAEKLSEILQIPIKNVLVKLFDVATQHDMVNQHRKGNVHGIYDVKDGYDIHGKRILLVDDIMTTGETLNNCALIMKIRGAEKVYCATAAITAKKKKD